MTPDSGGSPADEPPDEAISVPEAPEGAAPSAEASSLRGLLGQMQPEQLQLLLLRHAQRCTRVECKVCNRLRMRINHAHGSNLPVPPGFADDGFGDDGDDGDDMQAAAPETAAEASAPATTTPMVLGPTDLDQPAQPQAYTGDAHSSTASLLASPGCALSYPSAPAAAAQRVIPQHLQQHTHLLYQQHQQQQQLRLQQIPQQQHQQPQQQMQQPPGQPPQPQPPPPPPPPPGSGGGGMAPPRRKEIDDLMMQLVQQKQHMRQLQHQQTELLHAQNAQVACEATGLPAGMTPMPPGMPTSMPPSGMGGLGAAWASHMGAACPAAAPMPGGMGGLGGFGGMGGMGGIPGAHGGAMIPPGMPDGMPGGIAEATMRGGALHGGGASTAEPGGKRSRSEPHFPPMQQMRGSGSGVGGGGVGGGGGGGGGVGGGGVGGGGGTAHGMPPLPPNLPQMLRSAEQTVYGGVAAGRPSIFTQEPPTARPGPPGGPEPGGPGSGPGGPGSGPGGPGAQPGCYAPAPHASQLQMAPPSTYEYSTPNHIIILPMPQGAAPAAAPATPPGAGAQMAPFGGLQAAAPFSGLRAAAPVGGGGSRCGGFDGHDASPQVTAMPQPVSSMPPPQDGLSPLLPSPVSFGAPLLPSQPEQPGEASGDRHHFVPGSRGGMPPAPPAWGQAPGEVNEDGVLYGDLIPPQ